MAPSKAKRARTGITPAKKSTTSRTVQAKNPKPPSVLPQTPKPRARQYCRKCDGTPLHFRDECPVHSKSGKAKVLERQAQDNLEQQTSSPQAPPPQSWDPVTPTRPSGVPAGSSQYLLQRAGGMSSPFVITPSPLRFHHTPQESTPATNPDSVIDPVLLQPVPLVNQGPSRDDTPSPEPDSRRSEEGTPSASGKLRKKVVPGEFGYVQNVRDGLRVYKLARKHKLPKVADSRDLGTRNFKRRVKTILESCEDVSINTGACIFFGAYHPTQKSDKIWMYSSPKLLSKAHDFAKETSKSFYNTMRSMADAKRLEVQELQDRIDSEQARADEAETRAAELENNYERVQAQLAALQGHT